MGQNRVFSFISQLSAHRESRTPTPAPTSPVSSPKGGNLHGRHSRTSSSPTTLQKPPPLITRGAPGQRTSVATTSSASSPASGEHAAVASTPKSNKTTPSSSPAEKPRRNSRPLSMMQTSPSPTMEVTTETIPELQPVFSLLNSHSNKLYQEGYFLKLDDQDIRGKTNVDRTWTECFAQLVGTVLSLWDAAELDAAGEDGEVLPKYINLTDASIKMIESLPTKTNDDQPLQNILSISTAGRNRYLLHFNSHHSLIQWTSGIRLAMFEHSTLQEAYTGALIAGKGKLLNNINIIMDRARLPIQEWVRVRFGAGVPWRRCWCVIEPPSEKEYQKAQKDLKKRSAYDRSAAPVLKGEIRFYDSKKEADKKKKHSHPIATIKDAYSAYAIYPQSKSLIDDSTLLKIEGDIQIHSDPPSATEGFVFIMPETHPAVSGFEMLLRFLFPTWDTFGLYGRPGRLVASVLDPRSLMFAMPKHRRYGYLELLDVTGLIETAGSPSWSEREWRKRLKELTGTRMNNMDDEASTHSRSASQSSRHANFGPPGPGAVRPKVGFADGGNSGRSSRSTSISRPGARTDSAPPDPSRERLSPPMVPGHARNLSDTQVGNGAPGFDMGAFGNQPPAMRGGSDRNRAYASDLAPTPERVSSEDEDRRSSGGLAPQPIHEMQRMVTPEPVHMPPAFSRDASSRPPQKPFHSPEMRMANTRLSHATLSHMTNGGGMNQDMYPGDDTERPYGYGHTSPPTGHYDPRGQAVQTQTSASASAIGMTANIIGSRQVLTPPSDTPPAHGSPGIAPTQTARAHVQPAAPAGGPTDTSPPSARRTPSPGPTAHYPHSPGESLASQKSALTRGSVDESTSQYPPRSTPQHLPSSQRFEGPSLQPFPTQSIRQRNVIEAYVDDADSTASPDYASTRPSTDTRGSIDRDRPRAGVLKTTGDDMPASATDSGYSIPDINFGHTLNYGALLPATGPGATKLNGPTSPGTPQRSSSGRKSPGPGAAYAHFRQESSDSVRRSMVWQPGAVALGSPSPDHVVSPEQFVQQRAAVAAASPFYAHQRNASSNTLGDFRTKTPTSPLKRPGNRSASHSRHNSMELLSSGRPPSRGATNLLANAEALGRPPSRGATQLLSSADRPTSLSAREQEHVSRITGSPLVALAGNKKSVAAASESLVGAIQTREHERAQMKQGISGYAVAQAIDQRQREQNEAQRAAKAAYAQRQAQATAQQANFGAQSVYAANQGAINQHAYSRLSMSGPNASSMLAAGQAQSPGPMYSPQPMGYGPASQPWPQTVAPQVSYGIGFPAGQGLVQFGAGGWGMENMPHRPAPSSPMSMGGMAYGGTSVPIQNGGFVLPPQGQYQMTSTPPGQRPGTPGRMQFQGQAF